MLTDRPLTFGSNRSSRSVVGVLVLVAAWLPLAACRSNPTPRPHPDAVELVTGSAPVAPARPSREERASGFHAREGGLIRGGVHLWQVMGDYDGETVVVLDNDLVIVPEYDPTVGYEAGIGYRGAKYGFEATFKYIEPEGEFLGGVDDDKWYYLDLDFKRYFWLRSRIQPYLNLGIGLFRGEITNGATDGTVVQDSKFDGASLNVGGGLSIYLSRRLAIDGKAIYRFAETFDVETVTRGLVGIDGDLSASGYGVSIGLSYTLN